MDTATLIITGLMAIISICIYLVNKRYEQIDRKKQKKIAYEKAKKHLFFTEDVLGQILDFSVDEVKQGYRVIIKYNYGYCRKDFCVLVSPTETKTVYTVTHRE